MIAKETNVNEAFERASGPLRGFMEKNVREKDLRLFVDLSGEKARKSWKIFRCASSSRLSLISELKAPLK